MSDKCDNKLTMYASPEDALTFRKSSELGIGEDKLWFGEFRLWGIQRVGDGIAYKFQTSWEPPIEWLIDISLKYPEALFKLEFESFMKFEGVAFVKNGNISMCKDEDVFLDEECARYKPKPEIDRGFDLSVDLNEFFNSD